MPSMVAAVLLLRFQRSVHGRSASKLLPLCKTTSFLSGSIADNICFFDPDYNQDKLFQVARLAAIHDEIMAMPMTYNSLVGDMGSSLSAGQKQRVLLARALYREPRILFLDEGTAHLDVENERLINESLRQLRMTRISVAHRPDMASGADRIVRVFRGLQGAAPAPRLLIDAGDQDGATASAAVTDHSRIPDVCGGDLGANSLQDAQG